MEITATGVTFGTLAFNFFGMILALGLIAGGLVTDRVARARGEDSEIVFALIVHVTLFALVFSRIFYVMNPPPSVSSFYDRAWYLSHPLDLQVGPFAFWSGGLDMAGALVGAALGGLWVIWRRRLNLWQWLDTLTPGLLVTCAILPWANIVNQDLLGPPTNLPWGITVEQEASSYTGGTADAPQIRVHPTPAYLALWALVTLGSTVLIQRQMGNQGGVGTQFLLAALLYLAGLFLADFIRVDISRPVLGLTVTQGIAMLLLSVFGAIFVRRLVAARADR